MNFQSCVAGLCCVLEVAVDLPSSSAAILATANFVRFGIKVPQILIPEHPAIIDRVAVGAVVVAIGWIAAIAVVAIVSLNTVYICR